MDGEFFRGASSKERKLLVDARMAVRTKTSLFKIGNKNKLKKYRRNKYD